MHANKYSNERISKESKKKKKICNINFNTIHKNLNMLYNNIGFYTLKIRCMLIHAHSNLIEFLFNYSLGNHIINLQTKMISFQSFTSKLWPLVLKENCTCIHAHRRLTYVALLLIPFNGHLYHTCIYTCAV